GDADGGGRRAGLAAAARRAGERLPEPPAARRRPRPRPLRGIGPRLSRPGRPRSGRGGRVKLHRLLLVNFRLHQRTEVVFGDGLTGIIGPNGAGKPTLLEAIGFAIYGVRAVRG